MYQIYDFLMKQKHMTSFSTATPTAVPLIVYQIRMHFIELILIYFSHLFKDYCGGDIHYTYLIFSLMKLQFIYFVSIFKFGTICNFFTNNSSKGNRSNIVKYNKIIKCTL